MALKKIIHNTDNFIHFLLSPIQVPIDTIVLTYLIDVT